MTWKTDTPLHIREGHATAWRRVFRWWPTRTEQGNWVWMRCTYARVFIPPAWFTPGGSWWWQYSDVKRDFWECAKVEDSPEYQRGFEGGVAYATQHGRYTVPTYDDFDFGWNAGIRSVIKDAE